MVCTTCKKAINNWTRFCPWCGQKFEHSTLDAMTERIRHIHRYNDIAMARLIYEIYASDLYLSKYASFQEFGESEFHLKKAQIYNYKMIGENFVDEDGHLLIAGGDRWTIGKLNELRGFTAHQINTLIEQGIIHPRMHSREIRDILKQYK